MQIIETHPELLIKPFNRGVKLIKPTNYKSALPSIGSVFAMPLIIYLVQSDKFIDANYLTRLTNIPGNQGYHSHTDLKGTKFSALFKKENVRQLCHINKSIELNKKLNILEEEILRLDGVIFSTLTFKFPLFDDENKIIGLFGISALTDPTQFPDSEKSLSATLTNILDLGLITNVKSPINLLPGMEIANVYFSKQELKCIRMLILGKTIKLIAENLKLSPRTVEHYLENIKIKLNVRTKSELIEKIVISLCPKIMI